MFRVREHGRACEVTWVKKGMRIYMSFHISPFLSLIMQCPPRSVEETGAPESLCVCK